MLVRSSRYGVSPRPLLGNSTPRLERRRLVWRTRAVWTFSPVRTSLLPGGQAEQLVDYNEDFSAFHAATLRDQAAFLAHSIEHVLAQYAYLPAGGRPQKVTLLGHSMGGIAARLAMVGLPDLVDAIITMSTPHALPPVTLEWDMDSIWRTLGRQVYNASSPLLISICGGTADTQITSDACVIPQTSVTADDGFTIFTTGMPGAWTSVEHQAMVWCHQIRWRVARALLEMTATPSRPAKLQVAEKWFLGRTTVSQAPSHLDGSRRVVVTDRNMSLRISSQAYDPASPVRWCRGKNDCRDFETSVTILPAPTNPDAPFPLPGEGIRPAEQSFVIDVDVPEVSGWIQMALPENAEMNAGSLKQFKTQTNTWSGHSEMASHVTINFTSISTSSLMVHRLDLETPDCQGELHVLFGGVGV